MESIRSSTSRLPAAQGVDGVEGILHGDGQGLRDVEDEGGSDEVTELVFGGKL